MKKENDKAIKMVERNDEKLFIPSVTDWKAKMMDWGLTPIKKNMKVLDVGCGIFDKVYFETMKCNYTALDIEDYGFNVIGDARKMHFEDNFFDVVVAFSSLDHILEVEDAIREIVRVSKKYVVITVPNKYSIYALYKKLFGSKLWGYERCFSKNELRSILETNGLKILKYDKTGFINNDRIGFLCEKISVKL